MDSLPDEMVELIISYLNVFDTFKVATLCRRWSKAKERLRGAHTITEVFDPIPDTDKVFTQGRFDWENRTYNFTYEHSRVYYDLFFSVRCAPDESYSYHTTRSLKIHSRDRRNLFHVSSAGSYTNSEGHRVELWSMRFTTSNPRAVIFRVIPRFPNNADLPLKIFL
jgi:hypothetical protein